MFKKTVQLLALLVAIIVMVACSTPDTDTGDDGGDTDNGETTASVEELNILWAQWDPADFMQQVGDMYEEETGIAVNIVQEPWGSFQDRFFTEMAAQGTAWDMVIGDSQWLGQGSQQGHYVELTDFFDETGIHETVTEATLRYYGEYPTGSGRYWAFPTEGDADGWAYRQDLFEDPDEQAAFEEEYGYPLAVPEDYEQMRDIAEFFTRPDDGLYGVALYGQNGYDALTMGVQNTMFAWGGQWADENRNVMGVTNSDRNVEALEAYKDLWDCCTPPGMSNAFFTETNDAFINGSAVMTMNFFAFFPALVNPDVNPYADSTGFFPNPAGPYGDRGAALGGQGTSIISYISEERQQASLDFIEWFAQEEVQAEWAALGGYTCNANVLESDTFLNATPFNPAFAETMTFVQDFWNVPTYGEMLEVTSVELGSYVIEGQGTAQEAMDAIAEQHQTILMEAGLLDQ